MRLFIAIHLPRFIKDNIENEFRDIAGSHRSGLRFVNPKNIHLTLKFLGDTNPSILPDINNYLTEIANNESPIDISVEDIGAFPNIKSPGVFWVGVAGDVKRLQKLATAIDDATFRLGFEREKRRYVPHLTIARVKSKDGLIEMKRKTEDGSNTQFGSFTTNGFGLIKSTLTPNGPIYEEQSFFRFKDM